jgi:hypothetical protein
VIKANRGEWQLAAKTQLSKLFSGFGLPVTGSVTFVRGLHTRDGRYKAEVGLSSSEAALAIRKKFFSYVRPSSPDPMPAFLQGISINPSFTDATRVRIAILKVFICWSFTIICSFD